MLFHSPIIAVNKRPAGLFAACVLVLAACRDVNTPLDHRDATEKPRRDFATAPATAPDYVPQGLFDSLGTLASPDGHGAPWVRSIVSIGFELGASQAERQSAIDSIGGTVVGGFRIGDDGGYYVRIPGTTITETQATLATLRSLPQVEFASPFMLDTVSQAAYLKPIDGQGWRDWRLNPESTTVERYNWPLEAISAPLAWGCSNGNTADEIAVVDQGIIRTSMLNNNLDFAWRLVGSLPSGLYEDHGTDVAELLGAVGNDTAGATGVLWKAKLSLWDMYVSEQDSSVTIENSFGHQSEMIAHYVYSAGLRGAKIINLSMALKWQSVKPVEGNAFDVERREIAHNLLVRALGQLATHGKHPLVVIAAGNDSVDAKWGGYALAKAQYPDQVLVVGATKADGQVWERSNWGDTVDVYGPGAGVWVFGRGSTPHQVYGSSFAAPLATGIAGLLAGFDPRLTLPEIRNLIRQGARTVDGRKVLDAYASLKLAAQRPGAPLCGNRIWVEGDGVKVQRTSSLIETIIPSGISGSTYLSPYHGGKRFDLDYSREFTWSNGSWSEVSYQTAPDAEQGGAFWSYNGADHDAKQWVSGQIHRDTAATGVDTVIVTFTDSLGYNTSFRRTFSVVRPPTTCVADSAAFDNIDDHYLGNFCANRRRVGTWDDFESAGQSGSTGLFPVLSPQADFILMPLITMRHTVSSGAQSNCDRPLPFAMPPGVHDHCTAGTFADSSISLVIYRINIANGSWTPIALDVSGSTSRDRGYYEWLEVSDRGDQLVIGAGEHLRRGTVGWSQFGSESKVANTWTCTNGRDEWLSLATSSGSPPGTQLFAVSRPDPDPCAGDFEAGSSVAASLRPGNSPIIKPAHTRVFPPTRARLP